jgi:hypothetical protein
MPLKQPPFKRCVHVQTSKIANGPKAVCSGRRQDQDIETAVNEKFNHVIRPSLTENAGAVATIKSVTADLLFAGQSTAFFDFIMELAVEADAARRDL